MSLTKIQSLRTALNSVFFEREAEVDSLLVALLAGEHCLLLGPPGTGKSALAQALTDALSGRYFQRLFTPFTVPEEAFGPFSVTGLQNDKYERKIDGYLPTADIAFLDEIFKANSAILNSLLTALNERLFDQGNTRIDIPLKMCIGASNELPQDDSLGALYDRFVMRRWVEPIKSRDNRRKLLRMRGAPQVNVKISADELAAARLHCKALQLTPAAEDALLDLRDALAKECGIEMSDRRLRKAIKILCAFAAMKGDDEVLPEHLEILADSVWNEPSERAAVLGQILKVSNPAKAEAQKVMDAAVEAFEAVNLASVNLRDIGTIAALKGQLGEMARTIAAMSSHADIQAMAEQVVVMRAEVVRAATDALTAS